MSVTSIDMSLQRLSVEAEKAAAGAAAAKQMVRSAKVELKKARKLSKTAKKAAKLARKKVEAAAAANTPAVPPTAPKSSKSKTLGGKRVGPRSRPPAKGHQSASQVAKAVITRISASGSSTHAAGKPRTDSDPAPSAAEASAGSGFIDGAFAAVD